MSRKIVLALLAGVALAVPAGAAPIQLWSIGIRDHDYAEFAIPHRYQDYSRAFPHDVTYRIGQSAAKRDWPFIHPGPVDPWAGSREHPLRILFALDDAPKGAFTLTIALADTHGRFPPVFRVQVNDAAGDFSLPPGGGDGSLGDVRIGKEHVITIPLAASLLRRGENTITLTCTQGSWVLYDAVSLSQDAAAVRVPAEMGNLALHPTLLFVRRNGRLQQIVDVAVDLNGAVPGIALTLQTSARTRHLQIARTAAFGSWHTEAAVAPVTAAAPLTVTVTAAGKTLTASTTLTPQKHWKIFVAPSTHTDIGYTDLQPNTIARHNENTDTAIQLCRKFPDFKWNLEVAFLAMNYLKDRPRQQTSRFLDLVRDGRIGIQALLGNILTGLCSSEGLNRICSFACSLQRKYGTPCDSAMISDVPTQVWTLPTVLAQSGIRYFSAGANLTRASTFHYWFRRSPFWWQGPDGSRVLTWITPGYAQASGLGLDAGIDQVRSRLPVYLAGRDTQAYPYDAIFLHGAYSDNGVLHRRLVEIARAWNARYAYPRIILNTNDEFFRYIERNYASRIPVYSGDEGTYWEDGAGSTAAETALDRRTQANTVAAEMLHAFTWSQNRSQRYPADEIAATWRNSLLYDEHTWGAWCSISQPNSEQTVKQWAYKARFAHTAATESNKLLGEGLAALARQAGVKQPSVLVFNPLSWTRSGLVNMGAKELWAEDVPPLGYRVYAQSDLHTPSPAAPTPVRTVVENRFYRLTFDPVTGAVAHCVDKESGRDLVDAASGYGLDQYLYVSGGEGSSIVNPGAPKPTDLVIHTSRGAVITQQSLPGRTVTHIEAAAEMTPRVAVDVILWDKVKRIDFVNRLTKTATLAKEAGYFAFPFAVDSPARVTQPKFMLEIPDGVVRPNIDQFRGACRDWYTVQHFVSITGADSAIAWTPLDSPLVCLQDINRGRWQERLPITNGHLFAYVFNNYWFTNYKAEQGGELTFRFSLTSGRHLDRVQVRRFGWEASEPLYAAPAARSDGGEPMAASASFCAVTPANVMVLAVKQADDGHGLVVRLCETAGTACLARLKLPKLNFRHAELCNLAEEPQRRLTVCRGVVSVPLRGFGLATVKIDPAR